MPIKPENRGRYPANWAEISQRIRFERAGGKCESCGAEHGAIGYREPDGAFVALSLEELNAGVAEADELKLIKIILTTAHYPDPNPENCADENLHALCQRCHNLLDAPMRALNAARTRYQKRLDSGERTLF